MPWIVVFLLLTLLDIVTLDVVCVRLDDIYWNASNPIFRIDNTDHIIDVNKGNIPFEYDQVNIICPVYSPGTQEEDVERYIIYNVSKEEYDSCRINNPNSRVIAVCDKPHQLMYFTITFRSFTPQPGGLEFKPGQDYYFISTSGGGHDQLHQRMGGRCATHNMKIIFKVCCDPSKKSTTTTTTSSTMSSVTFPALKPVLTLSSTTTTTTSTEPVSTNSGVIFRWFPPNFPSKPPTIKTFEVPTRADKKKTIPKKKGDRDKLPNQTRAKNEELVNNIASDNRRAHVTSTMVSLVLLLVIVLQTR
ncbi:ephrin-B1-like isoform X3 [Limulus polyphemus]|uniref:Ephrin-B1-like isoform X3 n=1 Tax=Limulus polyphemus TaxID=6850 RepID=A0ABM1B047_LIMPO|nr:ephrin-B1-like isoform X3 [Limulus polyphemus]